MIEEVSQFLKVLLLPVFLYVCDNRCSNDQPRQSKPIAYFLHCSTGGAQRWRRNIGPAVVIEDDADNDIYGYHNTLGDKKRSWVLAGIAHLRHNGEKTWCA